MAKEIRPLVVKDNAAIMDAIRNGSSLDYQHRVPSATDAGITDTVRRLDEHRPLFNEFLDGLINRIGKVHARNMSWTNPLAEFKTGVLQYGDTIEEIQIGLLKAHGYDPDRDADPGALMGRETPDVQVNFHRVNRQEYYKITINEGLLRRAFLEPQGLSSFITQMLSAPLTSDNWDEFQYTTSLFSKYESNGGFFHINIPDVRDLESDSADSRLALRKMRAMTENLTFPSTRYNAAHMPVATKREDLVLFVTPEFKAAVDVEALAGAFNLDRANVYSRMIPIPADQFRIDGCQAIMTTRDFFVIADQKLETTSFWNAENLSNNYFLHHWQIISASRFVPAVMFHTGQDDTPAIEITPVTSVNAPTIEQIDGSAVTEAVRGQMIALHATVEPDEAQQSVTWSVTGNASNKTYITPYGVLHVAGNETAASLTVKASSTWIDPENGRLDPQSATLVVPVSGTVLDSWPLNGELSGITIDGVPVDGVDPADTAYTLALPAGTTLSSKKVLVTTNGPADANVTTTKTETGYDVVISVDPGTGAATTYTVTVTVG
jgi:hypothetical protein